MRYPNFTEYLDCSDGSYLVNWHVVHRILRSGFRGRLIKEHSTYQEMKWDSWFDRVAEGVGLLPEMGTMEINWDKVRTEENIQATQKLVNLRKLALSMGMSALFRELNVVRRQGDQAQNKFWQDYQALSKRNFQQIESKVSQLGTAVTVSQLVRDTSAEIFVVGATVMSGGTALGALAIGSVGKGVFKFQDTGNVGSALIETAGTFIFGAIPIGQAAAGVKAGAHKTATKYIVLVFAEAPLTVVQGLVEGKTVTEAAIKGTVKVVADPLAGALMKSKPVNQLLGKAGVQLTVKAGQNPLPKIAEGQIKKYTEKAGESLLRGVLIEPKKASMPGAISLETDLFCRQTAAWRPIYEHAVQPINSTARTTLQRIRGC